MSYRTIPVLLFFLAFHCCARAQQNNTWYFGDSVGLDFNTIPPSVLHDGKTKAMEGTAAISDSNGHLLFYTDGNHVWNRNHQLMPSQPTVPPWPTTGWWLSSLWGGKGSSSQAAIVIPRPEHPGIYYLFCVDEELGIHPAPPLPPPLGYPAYNSYGGLSYSVVDMSLQGGLGDLSTVNHPLLTPTHEKLTATRHCNGRDYWVLVHKSGGHDFYAYPVTPSGIGAPVVSTAGAAPALPDPVDEVFGWMAFSPDGSHLACAYSFQNRLELYHFNNATGVVSLAFADASSTIRRPYGVCFSPDNSKLYLSVSDTAPPANLSDNSGFLLQYDLNAGTSAAVLASKTTISALDHDFVALQLGPNGKIYVAGGISQAVLLTFPTEYVHVIDQPNNGGSACGFLNNAIYLGPAGSTFTDQKGCNLGLNNCLVALSGAQAAGTLVLHYNGCAGDRYDTLHSPLAGALSYLWDFGDPASGAANTSALQHPTHYYATPGTYFVSVVVQNNCMADTLYDTVSVSPSAPQVSAGNDTTICEGTSVTLQGGTSAAVTLSWSPASSLSCSNCPSPLATPLTSTAYVLTATDANGCSGKDTVTVSIVPVFHLHAQPADTLICPGDTLRLTASGAVLYQWSPGMALSDSTAASPLAFPATTTRYVVHSRDAEEHCPSLPDTILIRVAPPFNISAGPDIDFYTPGEAVSLSATGCAGCTWTWTPPDYLDNPSAPNPTATAPADIAYVVTAQTAEGCRASDTLALHLATGSFFLPDAFSPNGDGRNDRFGPVLSSKTLIGSYSLSVYNRWGEQVFSSSNTSQSWDGNYRGQHCETGVYYYFMQAFIKGKWQQIKGEVTLLR